MASETPTAVQGGARDADDGPGSTAAGRVDAASERRSPLVAVLLLSNLILLGLLVGWASGLLPSVAARGPIQSAPPATSAPASPTAPTNEFERAIAAAGSILPASPTDLQVIVLRLLLAAFLGGAIAFRGSRRRNEYLIVHSNIIVAFTGAMMMIIVGSDIARAFGLVGASSIVRFRTPVSDPRSLAGLFVAMAAGIAVGVGLYELAIVGTILVIVVEFVLDRGGRFISRGWYRPERNYNFALHTEEPDKVLEEAQRYFERNNISSQLMEYERGKKGDTAKVLLLLGVPEGTNMEELTREMLALGARSVSWESSKEQ